MNRRAAGCDFVVVADTNGVIQGGESLSSLSPALLPSENRLRIQNRGASSSHTPPAAPLWGQMLKPRPSGVGVVTQPVKSTSNTQVMWRWKDATAPNSVGNWCANTQLFVLTAHKEMQYNTSDLLIKAAQLCMQSVHQNSLYYVYTGFDLGAAIWCHWPAGCCICMSAPLWI